MAAAFETCDCGATCHLDLGGINVAICDAHDASKTSGYTWKLRLLTNRHRYLHATVDGQTITLHRFISDRPESKVVDHASGDTLDNRRVNLRVCTQSENIANSRAYSGGKSKYKGVHRSGKHWAFQVSRRGHKVRAYGFLNEADAAAAYDKAAIELHGQFARTNAMLGLLPTPVRQEARA